MQLRGRSGLRPAGRTVLAVPVAKLQRNKNRIGARLNFYGWSFGPSGSLDLRSVAMRFLPIRFTWVSLLSATVSLCACGGGHDDLAKRLASIQGDLTRLQNHSDRLEERLQTLEVRKGSAATRPTADDSAATVERPRLLVVKLEPGDDSQRVASDAPTALLRPEDSAADQSPRPLIRVYGSRTDVDLGPDNAKRKR